MTDIANCVGLGALPSPYLLNKVLIPQMTPVKKITHQRAHLQSYYFSLSIQKYQARATAFGLKSVKNSSTLWYSIPVVENTEVSVGCSLQVLLYLQPRDNDSFSLPKPPNYLEHTRLYQDLDSYHMEINVSGYIQYIVKYLPVFPLFTTTTTPTVSRLHSFITIL